MRKISIFALLLLAGVAAKAQNNTPDSDFRDRFFLGVNTSYYLDIVTTPLRITTSPTGNEIYDTATNQFYPEVADLPNQTTYITFFSFGLEPRYNIKEFTENLALAVSAPASVGFGVAEPANEDVKGVTGYGSFQIPVLVKLYLGSGSTYESNEDFGISAGGGFELNKVALINNSGEDPSTAKAWIMPTVSGGIHFWRGSSPMEVNVKYGFGRLQEYSVDRYNRRLLSGSRTTRASSFKLSFTYLLNY